eukprot:Gb_09618 [translate_table: standard]
MLSGAWSSMVKDSTALRHSLYFSIVMMDAKLKEGFDGRSNSMFGLLHQLYDPPLPQFSYSLYFGLLDVHRQLNPFGKGRPYLIVAFWPLVLCLSVAPEALVAYEGVLCPSPSSVV